MASQYERELRGVLAGIPKSVEAIIRSCEDLEKNRMRLVIERPFLVVRAAGSGMEGSGKLYLSGRTKEQYESMVYEGERCGLMPLYAYRLKGKRGDSWRIFRVEVGGLTGRLGILERRIPALPLTRNGKPYLDWEQGMPLNKFIALICHKSKGNTISSIGSRIGEAPMKKSDDITQLSITDMVQTL